MEICRTIDGTGWNVTHHTNEEESNLNFIFEALIHKYCPGPTDEEFNESLREASHRISLFPKTLEKL